MNITDSVIGEFDNRRTPFEMYELQMELQRRLWTPNLTTNEQAQLKIEHAAFSFCADFNGQNSLGTFFVPIAQGNPDIAQIDSSYIATWKTRARSCKNPIFISRYADLVWDLEGKINKPSKRQPEFGCIAFRAYLQAVSEQRHSFPPSASQALKRALDIAREMKDQTKIDEAINGILEYGKNAPAGILKDLYFHFLKSNKPSSEMMEKISSQLEQRLSLALTEDHQMEVESAVCTLDEHYRKTHRDDDRQRIARIYGDYYLGKAQSERFILASAWLLPVAKRYQDVGLKQEAENVLLYIETRSEHAENEMGVISVEISSEEIRQRKDDANSLLDELLKPNDLFLALFRACYNLLPSLDKIRELLDITDAECPIVSNMPRVMTDANGLPIANVGSMEDDPNGRVLEAYVQFLQMDFDYLCLLWPKAKAKFNFTAQNIVDSFKPSVLFDASYEELILQGVKAFDEGDYIKSLHVLVPQVERMMRSLLRTLGVPTIRLEKDNAGLIERKTLSACLNDPRVNEALEEKTVLFYKALYNEKRGFNLRNEIAHGLAPVGVFCEPFATLVIQSIILLSGLRPEFCYIKNEDVQRFKGSAQSSNMSL